MLRERYCVFSALEGAPRSLEGTYDTLIYKLFARGLLAAPAATLQAVHTTPLYSTPLHFASFWELNTYIIFNQWLREVCSISRGSGIEKPTTHFYSSCIHLSLLAKNDLLQGLIEAQYQNQSE